MNYALFAVSMYVLMRGLQVLLENSKLPFAGLIIKISAIVLVYAAAASLIVWYVEIPLLGFDPDK